MNLTDDYRDRYHRYRRQPELREQPFRPHGHRRRHASAFRIWISRWPGACKGAASGLRSGRWIGASAPRHVKAGLDRSGAIAPKLMTPVTLSWTTGKGDRGKRGTWERDKGVRSGRFVPSSRRARLAQRFFWTRFRHRCQEGGASGMRSCLEGVDMISKLDIRAAQVASLSRLLGAASMLAIAGSSPQARPGSPARADAGPSRPRPRSRRGRWRGSGDRRHRLPRLADRRARRQAPGQRHRRRHRRRGHRRLPRPEPRRIAAAHPGRRDRPRRGRGPHDHRARPRPRLHPRPPQPARGAGDDRRHRQLGRRQPQPRASTSTSSPPSCSAA